MKSSIQPIGHVLLSRMVYSSPIWKRSPQYFRLWTWFIGKASFADGHVFKGHVLKRGELITTYGEIAEALAYHHNRAVLKPSQKEIRIMISWMESENMILAKPLITGTSPNQGTHPVFTRAYVGLLVSIVNYDTYQDSNGYKGMDKGRHLSEQGQLDKTIIKQKENPDDFLEMKKRYDTALLDRIFDALKTTRKTGKISDSIIQTQLNKWDIYPVEQVESGIRVFLEKNCAAQGKDEKYLLGIIRSTQKKESMKANNPNRLPDWF